MATQHCIRLKNQTAPVIQDKRPEWAGLSRHLAPRFDQRQEENAYLSYLERRIARNPRDLFCHTQRIGLLHRERLTARCHDALVDLFLVLGPQGQDLRKRLLLTVKNSLSRPQRDFFAKHLKIGLYRHQLAGIQTTALLAEGLVSAIPLVTLTGFGMDQQHDHEEIAYALLDQGMIVECCQVWERSLRDDPSDATVTMELLSIYQHYDMRDRFFRLYMELAGRKLALKELWHHLDKHFRQQSRSRSRQVLNH